jgi:hypothetical protein
MEQRECNEIGSNLKLLDMGQRKKAGLCAGQGQEGRQGRLEMACPREQVISNHGNKQMVFSGEEDRRSWMS